MGAYWAGVGAAAECDEYCRGAAGLGSDLATW